MTISTEKIIKPKGELHEIQDSASVKSFFGVLLSEVRTNALRKKLRWIEMALYRITEGPNTGKYFLEIVGCSDVFHEFGGSCGSGVKTLSNNVISTARPCHDCNPALLEDGRPREIVVAMENDRTRVHLCDDAKAVVARLRDETLDGAISGPGQRLLNEAAFDDEEIRKATRTVERF